MASSCVQVSGFQPGTLWEVATFWEVVTTVYTFSLVDILLKLIEVGPIHIQVLLEPPTVAHRAAHAIPCYSQPYEVFYLRRSSLTMMQCWGDGPPDVTVLMYCLRMMH